MHKVYVYTFRAKIPLFLMSLVQRCPYTSVHPEYAKCILFFRIYEGLHDLTKAVKFYKDVLHNDSTHVEAIACIGTHHFYTDQPEVALRFYR